MRAVFVRLGATLAAVLLCAGLASGVFAQATPSNDMAAMTNGHPAHIHSGTCTELGEIVAPLSNVGPMALNNGTPAAMDTATVGAADAVAVMSSITTVDMSLQDIVGSPHALNVHESMENIQNYVACGNIGGMMIGATDLQFGLMELNDSGISGVASLHDNGDGTTTVYVYLTANTSSMATPVS
ncbi:MAG TPA: hypothetical protein PK691_03485 [Thermomicrobiales bacterium]|nr:hypothetical protein [Thermomicrobiales bacterium]